MIVESLLFSKLFFTAYSAQMKAVIPFTLLVGNVNVWFTRSFSLSPASVSSRPSRSQCLLSAREEAEAFLEKARKMREEVAMMEGKTLEQVEDEARDKKLAAETIEKLATERRLLSKEDSRQRLKTDGSFLAVPETQSDQIAQARQAATRAYVDGITRQVIRFALLPEDEALNLDRQWPGGAQQMYREAAGPMTRELLRQIKTSNEKDQEASALRGPNKVTSEDIWDFDGSALITAKSDKDEMIAQAMVLSNTDNKYTKDIAALCREMGEKLVMLVNPFWRDVESWGFNLLAPKAKQNAQEVIFDGGFQETYVLLQKTVQGEDCIALKAYPYDWQMYAYAETDYWPYDSYLINLGSTKSEPRSSDFVAALQGREEFKLSKNMRQVQRMMGKD